MSFRLKTLSFKASSQLSKEVSPVTVIVGPNNSGKSMALREIMIWAQGDDRERNVIDEIDVEWPPDVATALSELEPFETAPAPGEQQPPNSILLSTFRVDGNQERRWVDKVNLAHQLAGVTDKAWIRATVLQGFTVRLDGRSRFELMQPRAFQDLQESPQHHLAALFQSDDLRGRVREMIEKAFPGRYFVIDPTQGSNFRVRMSARPPKDTAEERNWDERAVKFHGEAELIEELSDGLVSFAGLVAAAISLPHRILLVDEPEAFLHPPLARQLGSNLASLTKERDASLVAATHSAEFLMGCISSGVEVRIVRLTYEAGVASMRMLAPTELKGLIRDPLLRSTDALSGLFHRGVIVGESDHDRAFYEEINRRLVDDAERGTTDTFFTNAQNWQTIPRIVGPLRKLGVAAAAIIDLDVICQTRAEWNKFYKVINVDEAVIDALDKQRGGVRDALNALPVSDSNPSYKKVGISRLNSSQKRKAKSLFKELAKYGVFVVDVGELESWLPSLDLTKSRGKGGWIVKAFEKLGSSPDTEAYVTPGKTDVWAFMDKIAAWINDPNRLGLPQAPDR
jgi:energy-coupling factor transporter ATP-binding protein EcfA2